MAKNFSDRLDQALRDRQTFLTVGLDPRPGGLPEPLQGAPEAEALREYLLGIVGATRESCVAFKMQLASYFAFGIDGLRLLSEIRREIGTDVLTVLDLKAADIPSTMELYRTGVFERLGFDAMTVNPYLGWETVEAALGNSPNGVFVLLHTSNPGSQDFQELTLASGAKLWRSLLPRIRSLADSGNVGAVVGATYPEALAEARTGLGPCVPLLVPGVGRQGGRLEDVLRTGLGESGGALLINASRSILEASRGVDWKEAARREAARLTSEMRTLSAALPGGSARTSRA